MNLPPGTKDYRRRVWRLAHRLNAADPWDDFEVVAGQCDADASERMLLDAFEYALTFADRDVDAARRDLSAKMAHVERLIDEVARRRRAKLRLVFGTVV